MSSAPKSIRPIRLRLPGLFQSLQCSLVAGLLAGCAVLPNWTYGKSQEVTVLVDYEVRADGGFVVLPASNAWLKVLQLDTRPDALRESFTAGQRRVHWPPDTKHLQVLCHYKLYPRRDETGRLLPWPTVTELFPGAARIRPTTTMTSSEFQQE